MRIRRDAFSPGIHLQGRRGRRPLRSRRAAPCRARCPHRAGTRHRPGKGPPRALAPTMHHPKQDAGQGPVPRRCPVSNYGGPQVAALRQANKQRRTIAVRRLSMTCRGRRPRRPAQNHPGHKRFPANPSRTHVGAHTIRPRRSDFGYDPCSANSLNLPACRRAGRLRPPYHITEKTALQSRSAVLPFCIFRYLPAPPSRRRRSRSSSAGSRAR